MGTEAAGAVPALIEALLNLTQWDREYALRCLIDALRAMGDAARPAVPAIRAKLASGEVPPQLRADLGVALAQLGEPAEGSAVLTAALEEMTPEERGRNSRSVTAVAALLKKTRPG